MELINDSSLVLRTNRFHVPGATFTAQLFETGVVLPYGKTQLAYKLHMKEAGKPSVLLFKGDDFSPGMGAAIDSDLTMRSLMTFMTLRPGDCDEDYFAAYTVEQLAYCDNHAEALFMAVCFRFGEEE